MPIVPNVPEDVADELSVSRGGLSRAALRLLAPEGCR